MTITRKEYFRIIESNNWEPLVVSPRPGIFLGTCRHCLEWRPLVTWDLFGPFTLEVDKEIENIPIEVDMRGEDWFDSCQPCYDAEVERFNEMERQEEQFDEDPMSLPQEVRERIEEERKQVEVWDREERSNILQCEGITIAGVQCKRTTRGYGFPKSNEWRCRHHRIECPHCLFLYPKMPVTYFGNTPMGSSPFTVIGVRMRKVSLPGLVVCTAGALLTQT